MIYPTSGAPPGRKAKQGTIIFVQVTCDGEQPTTQQKGGCRGFEGKVIYIGLCNGWKRFLLNVPPGSYAHAGQTNVLPAGW